MIGHKRFGSREGGVEVVVTELARRMAALGHEVTCYDRAGADVMTGEAANMHERIVDGVRVVPVRTVDKKGLAALSSSYFATLAAIKDRPDVIHYHAEGPCVPLPLAKRAGIRTVATIHGLDWRRAKWGKLASAYIKMGEKAAATKADALIVLSETNRVFFRGNLWLRRRVHTQWGGRKGPAYRGFHQDQVGARRGLLFAVPRAPCT